MPDFERRLAGRGWRARRVQSEKIASDHESRHVDGLEFGRRLRRHQLAVAQHRHDVGDGFDLLQPVGNVEYGDTLRLEVPDQFEQRGRFDRCQRRRRLVENCDAMRNGERPGDLRELALRDRQMLYRNGHRRLDPEHAHRLDRAPIHLPVVDGKSAAQLAPEEHVFGDRQVRREHDLLVNQNDAAPLRIDRALQLDQRTVELDRATGGLEMPAEHLHQRRLAGAVLADDRVDLAGAHADRDIAKNLDRAERARQPHRLEDGLG